MNIVNVNKAKRFSVLFSLYIATEADYDHALNVGIIGENRGLSAREVRRIFQYLHEEGFIKEKDGGSDFHASLTHKGVKSVEEVFLDLNRQTYYFPAYAIMRKIAM